MRCPDRELCVKVDPKLSFLGKNREKSGNFLKNEKRQYSHIFVIKIHVLT